MARIAGVNIPTNKRVIIALQYIHGIGPKKANEIMTKVGIPDARRVSQLTDQDRQKLQTLARAMKAHPASRIRIAGNCDELGTTEYNLALGQRRAEVARKYLIDLGVSGARVDTISYGEEHPVATGHDAESHAANRRDDAELLSTR